MKDITRLTVDLAKTIFQVAGFKAHGKTAFNRQIKRRDLGEFMANQPACEVVMEACYTSFYWARRFEKMGHRVRLLPAQHVAPYRRGNKNDRNDVIAINEAANREDMNDVPTKSTAQQDIQCLHRIRDNRIKQCTQLMNQTRGLAAEYGAVCPVGKKAFTILLARMTDPTDETVSVLLKTQFRDTRDEYELLRRRIESIEKQLHEIAKHNPLCQLLMTIPGIGVINATAIYSAIGNGVQFKSAREFAVWLGLTPKHFASGKTLISGGISKRGDRYLRKQLVHGARSLLLSCRKKTDRISLWGNSLVARRGHNRACVAMAARLARLCWILLRKNEVYRVM